MTDSIKPPLFQVKDTEDNENFFITREAVEKYREINKDAKTLTISNANSMELSTLLDIIKRNF